MICPWIAACLFTGFSLQTNLVVWAAGPLSLADCYYNQYKVNNGNQCTDCPECPAGQEYTKNCGYIEEISGKIRKKGKGCQECAPGYYKSRASPYVCDECRRECPQGTQMIHPCNKTHDMKCSKCQKGFYTAFDGSCVRCSPCCGTISEAAKHFVQKECEDAGMGSCSCRPLQNCIDRTGDCRKGFLRFSTENPSVKTSLSPTTTSTAKTRTTAGNKTIKPIISTTVPQKTTTSSLQLQNEDKKEENEQSFSTGWLVATVIGIALVAAIMFQVLKHFNIVKKIKVLLKPRQQVVEDDSHSVITFEERFQTPAGPVITNYAQRMLPEEEEESQSDHIPYRFSGSATDLDDYDYAYDPWVYRIESGTARVRPMKWPQSGAKVNPLYGDYIEILQSRDAGTDCLSTQGNNSGSLQQLDESLDELSIPHEITTDEQPPRNKDNKEMMQVNIDDKPGQEHSDGEEPPTSVPATASGENTFVIATGQHREIISDDFPRKEMSKGKRDKVKSRGKKQEQKKKLLRRTLDDDDSMRSADVFRCACGDCSYRPYVREKQLCHCTACVPQPMDDFYNIIERRCLRAEICKELNKKGVAGWRDLCTYIRIDKEITSIEKEDNSAEIVLEKLKSYRPQLQIQDFSAILKRIKRHDIMEIIMQHHVKCMLCRRNSFDASHGNVHTLSDSSTTWISSKVSAL